MKKLTSILATALMLSACAGTGGNNTTGTVGSTATGITSNLIKMYVNNQCVSTLQARTEWRNAALLMTAEKQAEWEDKICGCVTEEAPNHITAADLTGALTEAGRTKLMTEITAKTVTACYKRLFTDVVKGQ